MAAAQFLGRCPVSNSLFAGLQPPRLHRPRKLPMLGRAALSAASEPTP